MKLLYFWVKNLVVHATVHYLRQDNYLLFCFSFILLSLLLFPPPSIYLSLYITNFVSIYLSLSAYSACMHNR